MKWIVYLLSFTVACLWTWSALIPNVTSVWNNQPPEPTLFHYGWFLVTIALETPRDSLASFHFLGTWLLTALSIYVGMLDTRWTTPVMTGITTLIATSLCADMPKWSSTTLLFWTVTVLGLGGTWSFFQKAHHWWYWLLNPLTFVLLMLAWIITASVTLSHRLKHLRGIHVLGWIGLASLWYVYRFPVQPTKWDALNIGLPALVTETSAILLQELM